MSGPTLHATRPFDFKKRRQLFICVHNETLSVAMRISNPDCSPLRIRKIAERYHGLKSPLCSCVWILSPNGFNAFLHLSHNLAPDFTHYLSKRPEMSSQDESSPKAKTMKGN
jgi:hypothetical protein